MDPGRRPLAGRYRLDGVLGRGGMSTVYRATDLVLGRTVAVKILLAALAEEDPTYVARFEREARAAAALANSSVVTVYDTGVDDGARFIVMEYVAGRSLGAILAEGEALPVEEAVRIAERVAGALAAAHAAGILHRDIKPANVMVADDGTVKVLDFGIARRLDATTLTQVASVVGTAAYMAPERALGETGDERADIYSLGCLLYAMLTGRPPFTGEVAAVILHQQINSAPRPPAEARGAVPAALDALVLAMLAKAPAARPQTAGELRDRLAALAASRGGRTALAVPATAPTLPTARIGRTAATRPIARAAALRPRGAPRGWDHRRRAVVMAIATGALALAVIALASGGGSPHPATSGSTVRRVTRSGTAAQPSPPVTTALQATTATQPAVQSPKPSKPPKDGGPPGHGGKPHGQAKKHDGGGD